MAGMTLHFDIAILEVREATAEEIAHGHVHGPGGHHDEKSPCHRGSFDAIRGIQERFSAGGLDDS